MDHPFKILLRSVKVVEFAEGLQKGHWDTKELANLKCYVEQLKGQLWKEGNWWVTMVMKSQSDDFGVVCKQRVNTQQQIRSSIPCPVVASAAPTLVAPPICPTNTRVVSHLHSNPWGSISWRWGHHFQSHNCTLQSNFHSQNSNSNCTQYIIPPLRPTLASKIVSSSLSFPAHLFSRFFDHNEGVTMREGGTWSSSSGVPEIP
jgi:hypothetical protein